MVFMADIYEPGAQPKAMPDVSIDSTHQDVACWIMFYHEQFHMANNGSFWETLMFKASTQAFLLKVEQLEP